MILQFKVVIVYLWHVWLSRSRSPALDEELNIVTGYNALLDISLKQTPINVVFASVSCIDFPLDVERSETAKQRSENERLPINIRMTKF